MNKEDIEKIVRSGIGKGYSHVMIICDTWDYDYYTHFVEIGEDINEAKKNFRCAENMQQIVEIYNYALDIDDQLNEPRSYHDETIECKISKVETPIESSIVKKAIEFAKQKHQGQKRKTGEDYFMHPLEVAALVFQFKKSKNINNLCAAALLHDTLEDTDCTVDELNQMFGPDITNLVIELTNDKEKKDRLGKTQYLKEKMVQMSSWGLTIKLCDRLHNVTTLEDTDEDFKRYYTQQTNEIVRHLTTHRDLSGTQHQLIDLILDHTIYPIHQKKY